MPWLIQLLIGVVLTLAKSLIDQALAPKQKEPGVRGSVTMGGDEPLSFIIGRYGSAGHLEYEGTWGSSGDTPNAFHTRVLSFSDLPIRRYNRFFVYGEAVTLGPVPHPTRGYPVLEYRKGSKDHLWIKLYDGTQTAADPLLLAAFGTDPDRPWQADMIGRGVAYCVFTALVNRELFSGFPEYFAEVDGYDLGDDDLNDAPAAFIRKTLHGFSYGGEWIWGLQGLPATRTPAANWDAQIAKCNLPIALLAGGTEKQYRAGAEISVDQQPIEVIPEWLNSCSGRIAEIGGIYKILVGAPAAPVVSYTDEDIIVTEGQTLDPFPGLESTFNGVNATYPEPAEKWGMKDAPALRSLALEEADDNRRLPADVSLPMVYSGTQVQRVMQAMHLEDRRHRTHTKTMPPWFWEYEVLDTTAWTSVRNGYINKIGLITMMDDLPNGNQFIGWKEQDPADYAWNPGTDERPYTTVPIIIARPTPQPMTGWGAAPAYIPDNEGLPRRPTIETSFASGLVDVRAARVQVRLAGAAAPVFDAELPYDSVETEPSALLYGTFLSVTAYEVRGKYLPFSGRETLWSNQDSDGTEGPWLAVTTPPVVEFDLPPIAPEDLGPEMAAAHGLLAGTGPGSLTALIATWEDQLDKVAGAVTTASMTANAIRESLIAQFGDASAAIFQEKQVRASETAALALQINELVAQLPNMIAGGFLKFEVSVNEVEASSTIMAKAYAEQGGTLSQAATMWRASVNSEGETEASFAVLGALYVLGATDGEWIPVLVADPETSEVTMNVANIGEVRSGLVRDAADTFRFDLDNMRIYRTNGTFDIDAKNGRIRIRKLVP